MSRKWDGKTMTHIEECGILNSLLIDIRKQLLGYEHNPITNARLDDCSKALGRIQQCRQQALFKGSR